MPDREGEGTAIDRIPWPGGNDGRSCHSALSGRDRQHIRAPPASGRQVREASEFFRAEIWVDYRGIRGNGKSILDLVGLTAECATLDLEARGPDALEALAALAHLAAAGFHMPDEDARR